MAGILTIRRAALTDARDLAVLSGVLGYPVATELFAGRLAHVLDQSGDIVLVAVVADASDRIAGWIHGAAQELLESGRHCEILGLVVDAEHRCRGIGRGLVRAVEAWAVTQGLDRIEVHSNVLRAESHPFYERLGFVRVKTQHVYSRAIRVHAQRGQARITST